MAQTNINKNKYTPKWWTYHDGDDYGYVYCKNQHEQETYASKEVTNKQELEKLETARKKHGLTMISTWPNKPEE